MTEGDFYIFLSSKDSLRFHPDNKGYNFTVELPESGIEGELESGALRYFFK